MTRIELWKNKKIKGEMSLVEALEAFFNRTDVREQFAALSRVAFPDNRLTKECWDRGFNVADAAITVFAGADGDDNPLNLIASIFSLYGKLKENPKVDRLVRIGLNKTMEELSGIINRSPDCELKAEMLSQVVNFGYRRG